MMAMNANTRTKEGPWIMTRSKVDDSGTIIWGLFEKVIAWAIIGFLAVTLGAVVTTSVLIVKVDSNRDTHDKDMGMVYQDLEEWKVAFTNGLNELKGVIQNGTDDRYTGTQAAADRAAASAERGSIRQQSAEQAALIAQLQMATTRFEVIAEQHEKAINEAREERHLLEEEMKALQNGK